ncbi:MAG: non-homologous end-joining DNA ligase [Candidatus Acidiferrales bacterium]
MKKTKKEAKGTARLPVNISNPDKIFWADEGYTKIDLAEFYQAIFPKLAPYVRDRLLTMERCPDGLAGECFYQKEMPKGMPAGTPSKRIENEGGRRRFTNYVVGGTLETQIALVNLGCIAVHAMGGRASSPRQPDWVCFDLDPESGEFADAARAALHIKEGLDALKLVSFPKTSGSRGMHVFVPIRVGPDASDVLSFAQAVVGRVAAAHSNELTVEHSIAARKGRVYLDPFRNGFGQTVVMPYSVRRKPKAPVSTPLSWAEVKPGIVPSKFNIGNFAQRAKQTDPWRDFFQSRQSLDRAVKQVKTL